MDKGGTCRIAAVNVSVTIPSSKPRARNAYDKVWKKLPAKERAKYIFRISRIIQEKARELAVIETLDGGKPIKESRDFDIPAAANHFLKFAVAILKINVQFRFHNCVELYNCWLTFPVPFGHKKIIL